jgi:hypothetical protein
MDPDTGQFPARTLFEFCANISGKTPCAMREARVNWIRQAFYILGDAQNRFNLNRAVLSAIRGRCTRRIALWQAHDRGGND